MLALQFTEEWVEVVPGEHDVDAQVICSHCGVSDVDPVGVLRLDLQSDADRDASRVAVFLRSGLRHSNGGGRGSIRVGTTVEQFVDS